MGKQLGLTEKLGVADLKHEIKIILQLLKFKRKQQIMLLQLSKIAIDENPSN